LIHPSFNLDIQAHIKISPPPEQTHYLKASPFGKGRLVGIFILIEKHNDVITRYPLIND
jgi:hypothetical protein